MHEGLTAMVILLLEDDVQVRFFILKLLKADGFTVLTAGEGEAALEASRNYPGSIDLLLSDVETPRMSGLELYKIIAVERPGIKALMISGDFRNRQQVAIIGLPFLQKPFSPAALPMAISVTLSCLNQVRIRIRSFRKVP